MKATCSNHVGPAFVIIGAEDVDIRVIKQLESVISDSVRENVSGRRKVGVMFSGGLDSTVIGFLALKFNRRTKFYTIGTNNSQDVEWAKRVALELGVQLEIIGIDEKRISGTCFSIKNILKTDNLFELELGFPSYLCSETAERDGVGSLLSGHGADELFGGYDRYPKKFSDGEDVGGMMKNDLEKVLGKDVVNSRMLASNFGVEVMFPFLSNEVIRAACSIPVSSHFPKNLERKPVLRQVARELGIPRIASERPKKALQYGSGIHRVLLRLSRAGKLC